jgi:tyrosinase
MAFIRKNAWNHGGTFDNPDLLWYAKAVEVMKSRPINDCTSWWFYAAIHGQHIAQTQFSDDPVEGYPNWKNIPAIPASVLEPLPPSKIMNTFWDQCQHGSGFFLPWHRGYLVALENILRDIIIKLNGPVDWALPYWNYLKTGQNYIPPAFAQKNLPDGKANPLYVLERYGPNKDSKVYVVIEGTEGLVATDACQLKPNYIASNGYGGLAYSNLFQHFSHDYGAIESNPHNYVHRLVGNTDPYDKPGLMLDPDTAALDPIFYIHHCNIDRMWAAWNETGKNSNPTESDWSEQPNGNQRHFAMTMDAAGTEWRFTPKDVTRIATINYPGKDYYAFTYDDLTTRPSISSESTLQQRLMKLGVDKIAKNLKMGIDKEGELVGRNIDTLTLGLGTIESSAQIQIDKRSWESVSKSLKGTSALPDEIYLRLENVRSVSNANYLSVYVNDVYVKTVTLFGIRKVSLKDGVHGGLGLTFRFDITNIIDNIHLMDNIDAVESLHVKIKVGDPIITGHEITIGQISVYRLNQ